jgi:hypothetical protein
MDLYMIKIFMLLHLRIFPKFFLLIDFTIENQKIPNFPKFLSKKKCHGAHASRKAMMKSM